jgi:NAD(P)-dependent dehydrogenase (short-subunit alcohol dehydrogenase family)
VISPAGPNPPEDGEFAGHSAVITGAGSGIGRAIALLLAGHGAHVIAVDRRAESLSALRGAIEAEGRTCQGVVADVTDASSISTAMDNVVSNRGRLDILVNCAGVVVPPTPIAEFDEHQFDRLMAVNVKGVFLGMRHALPHMRAAGRGVILNVGSVTAVKTIAGLGPYGASKQAVTALTRAAAVEAAPFGIRVNELLPGPTLTPMVTGPPGSPTGAEHGYAEQVPLGRVSTPQEQAEAALFLLSRRSGYVTGASLLVDGGLSWT